MGVIASTSVSVFCARWCSEFNKEWAEHRVGSEWGALSLSTDIGDDYLVDEFGKHVTREAYDDKLAVAVESAVISSYGFIFPDNCAPDVGDAVAWCETFYRGLLTGVVGRDYRKFEGGEFLKLGSAIKSLDWGKLVIRMDWVAEWSNEFDTGTDYVRLWCRCGRLERVA
jgi:hypothetical protein